MSRVTVDGDGLRQTLAEVPLIAMITEPDAPRLPDVVAALGAAGVAAVEITLTSPGALDAVRRSVATRSALVGAGTVLTPAIARQAVEAGADYLLTPGVLPDVMAEANRLGVPLVCGAFTLTEVLAAWRGGAQLVKLFPAWLGGPPYVASISRALPEVPLVPTGGVTRGQIKDYLVAGAAALALGREIVGDALDGGDVVAVAQRATELKAILDDARAEMGRTWPPGGSPALTRRRSPTQTRPEVEAAPPDEPPR